MCHDDVTKSFILEAPNCHDDVVLTSFRLVINKFGGHNMINCSWISRYAEENERLWIGYPKMYPLRIEGIRIMDNSVNHQAFFHALWLFDVIISGSVSITMMKPGDVTTSDVLILQMLINSITKSDSDKKHIDPFLSNCFHLYCLNKKKIVLKIQDIYRRIHVDNHCKLPFLFHEMVKSQKWPKEQKDNLLDKEFLLLFSNVRSVEIDTSDRYHDFDHLSFLGVINNNSRDIHYVIKGTHFSDDEIKIYETKGWTVNLGTSRVTIYSKLALPEAVNHRAIH